MIERYCTPEMTAVWSREAKYRRWLEVELAVCRAHAELGNLPSEALGAIESRASFDLERCDEIERQTRHDLMAFVRNVSENVGPEGRWIHFGITSYDVIDTALGMMMRDSCAQIVSSLEKLGSKVAEIAKQHVHTPMIGRTHGIHAEPISFGFKLAGWHAEIQRSMERVEFAKRGISVGKISGAVGVHAIVSPELEKRVCELLDLKPDEASTQIVSRDRMAHLFGVLATTAGSLERFATELRNLQRTEILEVQEEFGAGQTGSSAMPHKRNPWNSETICGLARIVRSNAAAVFESQATWHERDLTNSSVERVVLPDTFQLVDFMIQKLTSILNGLKIFPEAMAENMKRLGDLVFSEHLMLALIKKGLTREEAYAAAQRNAAKAWAGEDFKTCLKQDEEIRSKLSEAEIEECFDLRRHLRFVEHTLRAAGIL